MISRRIALLSLLTMVAACGDSSERGRVMQEQNAPSPPATVTMSMTNTPSPPKMGANTVTVTVQQGGDPISDATVSGEFFMPVMESMGKTVVEFVNDGNGRYTAIGNLSMAGSWQVAVTATRAGQTVATRTFNLTTKE